MTTNKKHVLAELSKADYITCLSIILIVSAFWLLWNGQTYLAIATTFVSMFFDYLDGRIARKHGGSPYGKVLDSLYDILGWVLFPALVVNIQSQWAWWAIVITTVYCLFAAIRLSRFTVAGYVETSKRYYTGMPVSYSRYALLVVLLVDAKISALILATMIPLMVSSRLFRKSPLLFMQINLLYAAIFFWLFLKHG
jgi:CDP-diacylglycerol--serine O-phosphatidyltransferase